jgi:hypothetical protein
MLSALVAAGTTGLAGLAGTASMASAAEKKDEKKPAKLKKNQAYVAPDFAKRNVRSIAMTTPTAVEKTEKPEETERLATQSLGAAFSSVGYKMVPPSYVVDQSTRGGVAAQLAALQKSFLAGAALDTAACRAVGEKLLTDAILFTNMTTLQRVRIDPNVRGQSFTQVGGELAMYSMKDATVLWRGSFQEKMDGPYNEPSAGEATNIDPTGNASQAARLEPPSYAEVLQKFMERVATTLPKPPAEAKPAP